MSEAALETSNWLPSAQEIRGRIEDECTGVVVRLARLEEAAAGLTEITSEQMASDATLLVAQINTALTELESIRKGEKGAFDAGGKVIQAYCTAVKDPAIEAKKGVEDKQVAWLKAKRDAAAAETPHQQLEAQRSRTDYGQTTTLITTWDYEVLDINKVPREYLMVDNSKVNAAIRRKNDPVREIPGIAIAKRERAQTRS